MDFRLDNTNRIYGNGKIAEMIDAIEKMEETRIYCKHDFSHYIDVARICYIISLEKNFGYSKDMIYVAALLHDLGRYKEYQDGTDHSKASVNLAKEVLKETSFSKEEKEYILYAIKSHRGSKENSILIENDESNMDEALETETNPKERFAALFKKADKLSRVCFRCKARESCKWSQEKKNNFIKY